MRDSITLGMAQIAPVWLNRAATLKKITEYVMTAANDGCDLVAFGEALLPGYPFWIGLTDGARWNAKDQKEFHSLYMDQAVCLEHGHLDELCEIASQSKLTIVLGIVERPLDRGGHSLYCSLVYINREGIIESVHRKLMPTYDERLTWSIGDGNGLKVHGLERFTVGCLNCWENWMPMARTALYGLGEDLHIAIWPGSARNTKDITRFIALESRSYVLSVSAMMNKSDFTSNLPYYDRLMENSPEVLCDGGSCLAGPDGNWLIEPVVDQECFKKIEIDHGLIREERQNFDPSGHYSRPDVFKLNVNRERQRTVNINNNI